MVAQSVSEALSFLLVLNLYSLVDASGLPVKSSKVTPPVVLEPMHDLNFH